MTLELFIRSAVVVACFWLVGSRLHLRLWDRCLIPFALLLLALPAVSALPSIALPFWSTTSVSTVESGGVSWFAGIWILGASFFALRRLLAVRRLALLPLVSIPEDDREKLEDRTARIAQRLRLKRVPRLLLSDRSGPAVWGVLRPILLLPREAIDWSSSQLEAVLLHELAHLKRNDPLKDALLSVAVVLYWWNPAVWFLRRRYRKDRESICDRIAVRAGCSPTEYARVLLNLAVPSTSAPALAMAGAGEGKLESRIARLLEEDDTKEIASLSKRVLILFPLVLIILAAVAIGPDSSTSEANDPLVTEISLRLTADPFPVR